MLLLWLLRPLPLSSPGSWQPSNGSDGGGEDVNNYLVIARGPGNAVDVAGSLSVDLPPVEPETETQTGATHYYGDSDWAGEAPRIGNRRDRTQPSTRGALRVYVTHYSAPIGATIASEHPAGFRPGICATYAVRDGASRIVGAHLPGHGPVQFGTIIVIDGDTRCTLLDTGDGYVDSRAWVDVAVVSDKLAKELGAGWREVEVLEGNSHD